MAPMLNVVAGEKAMGRGGVRVAGSARLRRELHVLQ
jgi:hypothetical protein